MPKKKDDGGGKKAEKAKKAQKMSDLTFGMKNKNKSAKVQEQVRQVEKSVMNGGDQKARAMQEKMKVLRNNKKAQEQAKNDERDALFGAALLAVEKKTTTKLKGGGDAIGRDGGDDDKKAKPGQSRAMKMMFQMDAQEMEEKLTEDPNYVRTLEDEVEMQRQMKLAELREKGEKGTPVTEATLKEWVDKKRKRKEVSPKANGRAKKTELCEHVPGDPLPPEFLLCSHVCVWPGRADEASFSGAEEEEGREGSLDPHRAPTVQLQQEDLRGRRERRGHGGS